MQQIRLAVIAAGPADHSAVFSYLAHDDYTLREKKGFPGQTIFRTINL